MPGESILVIDDSPTILKVVQLVLTKAGYEVRTAADGEAGLALARQRRPELILLDFVMPKLNGYQVCRALADAEGLRDVPVVLMSAKGDQVGERFVKVMGIVDYITKPFSPEAMTAVVAHTIVKYGRGAVDPARTPLVVGADEAPLGDTMTGDLGGARASADRADAAQATRRAALAELREGIAQALASRPGVEPDHVGGVARAALDDDTLEGLLGTLGARAPELSGGVDDAVLVGELRVVPIAEVLQLLHAQQQTGALTVTRAQGKVDVFFQKGRVDFAAAAGVSEEFLLGRFIVECNLMARQDLDLFLRSRQGSTKLLGSQLVRLGYLTEADLKQAITKQTCELVYEVLRWNFGRFTFRSTRELPAVAVDASLGLNVEGILMEGFRRVDEWHLIEREIDSFDVVFLRNEDALAQMGRGRLTREELAVLELVNGKNSIKEIIRQSRMGSFEVTKMLYRLLSIKLLRRRVLPVAV